MSQEHNDDFEQSQEFFPFFDAAENVPSTVQEYAASTDIIHEPVAASSRPHYYFEADNRFPRLPQAGIRENLFIGRLRRGGRIKKHIDKVIDEIVSATYDGVIKPETVFVCSHPIAERRPAVRIDSVYDSERDRTEYEPLPGPEKRVFFTHRTLRALFATCLAFGALMPAMPLNPESPPAHPTKEVAQPNPDDSEHNGGGH